MLLNPSSHQAQSRERTERRKAMETPDGDGSPQPPPAFVGNALNAERQWRRCNRGSILRVSINSRERTERRKAMETRSRKSPFAVWTLSRERTERRKAMETRP